MAEQNQFETLDCIGVIYEKAEDSKLDEKFFESCDGELELLSNYLKTTKSQALFVAVIFTLNYKGDWADYNDLMEFFDCKPIQILRYKKDFDYLHSNCFLKKRISRHRAAVAGANDQFTVNQELCSAILDGELMPVIKSEITDIFELLEEIYDLCQQRDEYEITTKQLILKSKKLLEIHGEFPLILTVRAYDFKVVDIIFYLYLVWKTISGRQSYDVSVILNEIFDKTSTRVTYMQNLQYGNNPLIKEDFIELLTSSFINDTDVKLTQKSNDILDACDIKVFKNKVNRKYLIAPEDVKSKELIFDETEMKQLYLLKDVLKPKQFKLTQKRLEEKSLQNGITVLLHGHPGTGKTEVVKQIAKDTGREIMKVDISQSKSKWFGESEKVVKRILTNYRELLEESELAPILFLNEADAIIGKRSTIGDSNTAQTENTIQNILLEEIENFEGILIATTNLARNLDSAFERRFLFKILFNSPSSEIRAKIWKSKLPEMNSDNCKFLAERYNFSGGQIDNIIRKSEINEVIRGDEVSFENLLVFCSEETIAKERSSIGFGNKIL